MESKSIIFFRILTIIDMVGIMFIAFFILGGFFTVYILVILCIVIQINFNKIIDEVGIRKLSIILLIPILIPIVVSIIVDVKARICAVQEWNKVKNDYEIINEIVINYYNENKYNKDIIGYNEEDDKFISIDLDILMNKFRTLNSNERLSLNNIKQYLKENARIYYNNSIQVLITDYYIRYFSYSEKGLYEVIYYKNKPNNKEISENNLEHLTGNWYQTIYIHYI